MKRQKRNNRYSQRSSNSRSSIKQSNSQRTLLQRKPFTTGFNSRWEISRLSNAQQKTNDRKLSYRTGKCMQHTDQRPSSGKNSKAFPSADAIDYPPTTCIHQSITKDKYCCDICIISIRPMKLFLYGRSQNRQCISVQTIQPGNQT